MKAIELLAEFIERNKGGKPIFARNEWLQGDDMEVYVRKSVPRYLNDGDKYVTLDIANVTVYHKSQGHFTEFLEKAEELSPWPIYVESVLQPRFGEFLKRAGYTEQKDRTPPSYYKMKAQIVEQVCQ